MCAPPAAVAPLATPAGLHGRPPRTGGARGRRARGVHSVTRAQQQKRASPPKAAGAATPSGALSRGGTACGGGGALMLRWRRAVCGRAQAGGHAQGVRGDAYAHRPVHQGGERRVQGERLSDRAGQLVLGVVDDVHEARPLPLDAAGRERRHPRTPPP
eukprot:5057599-Prymnesium_polylepis.1